MKNQASLILKICTKMREKRKETLEYFEIHYESRLTTEM